MVDDTLALKSQLSGDESIHTNVHDRLSRNEEAKSGRRDIMTEDEFKDAARKRSVNERACTLADYREIQEKRSKWYCLGRTPAQLSDHGI